MTRYLDVSDIEIVRIILKLRYPLAIKIKREILHLGNVYITKILSLSFFFCITLCSYVHIEVIFVYFCPSVKICKRSVNLLSSLTGTGTGFSFVLQQTPEISLKELQKYCYYQNHSRCLGKDGSKVLSPLLRTDLALFVV